MLQFNAGIRGGELPIRVGVMLVAIGLPSGDLLDQGALVRDAAIQTLGRQNAKLGLGPIEPTAVLGGVVPLEALDEPWAFSPRA